MTNKERIHKAWSKALKMFEHFETMVLCCEDVSDLERLEREERMWGERVRRLRRLYIGGAI